MTVAELREILKDLPGEMPVAMIWQCQDADLDLNQVEGARVFTSPEVLRYECQVRSVNAPLPCVVIM